MMNRIFKLSSILIFFLYNTIAFCANENAAIKTDSQKVESNTPSYETLKSGRENYQRYCASCHGKDGEGNNAPAITGSLIATGPVDKHIEFVLTGKSHTTMPAWGLTGLSDEVLADIITYQRNAWGNNDKDKYGKDAGGIATSEMIKKHREDLEKKPAADNIRL